MGFGEQGNDRLEGFAGFGGGFPRGEGGEFCFCFFEERSWEVLRECDGAWDIAGDGFCILSTFW